jgi:hypothetical protein
MRWFVELQLQTGFTRKILSQMDGPMPGYVTLVAEVSIDPGTLVARHTQPGNRIQLRRFRRSRAADRGTADAHAEAGRRLPSAGRNTACRCQERRHKDSGRQHLCRGEGQAARVASLIKSRIPTNSFQKSNHQGGRHSWRPPLFQSGRAMSAYVKVFGVRRETG